MPGPNLMTGAVGALAAPGADPRRASEPVSVAQVRSFAGGDAGLPAAAVLAERLREVGMTSEPALLRAEPRRAVRRARWCRRAPPAAAATACEVRAELVGVGVGRAAVRICGSPPTSWGVRRVRSAAGSRRGGERRAARRSSRRSARTPPIVRWSLCDAQPRRFFAGAGGVQLGGGGTAAYRHRPRLGLGHASRRERSRRTAAARSPGRRTSAAGRPAAGTTAPLGDGAAGGTGAGAGGPKSKPHDPGRVGLAEPAHGNPPRDPAHRARAVPGRSARPPAALSTETETCRTRSVDSPPCRTPSCPRSTCPTTSRGAVRVLGSARLLHGQRGGRQAGVHASSSRRPTSPARCTWATRSSTRSWTRSTRRTPDAGLRRALAARHGPRRHRHAERRRAGAGQGGPRPARARPRDVRRAGLGVEGGVRRPDPRPDAPARRRRRLDPRAVHDRRRALARRPRRSSSRLYDDGPDLPRPNGSSTGARAATPRCPTSRSSTRTSTASSSRPLSARRRRRHRSRGHHPRRDDARRHRRRRAPGRRALPGT